MLIEAMAWLSRRIDLPEEMQARWVEILVSAPLMSFGFCVPALVSWCSVSLRVIEVYTTVWYSGR